jgi:hypothetical protein
MLPGCEEKFVPVGAAVVGKRRRTSRTSSTCKFGPADAPEQNLKFTRPAVQFTRLLQRWRRAWSTRGVKGESIAEVSAALGCEPPLSVPKWVWKWAWEVFKAAMPLLHLFDRLRPSDTCVNLSVAWWKAIAGNRRGAITSDGGLAWDLLPPVTRHIVGYPLCLLFPRLHHQNVALRTAFLDAACQSEVRRAHAQGHRVRLVALGAGFDTRSLKFAGWDLVGSYEVDLPEVVAEKKRVLEERLLKRRPSLASVLPTLVPGDLNHAFSAFESLYEAIAQREMLDRGGGRERETETKTNAGMWQGPVHTVFVCEALMIYLRDGAPEVRCCPFAAYTHTHTHTHTQHTHTARTHTS